MSSQIEAQSVSDPHVGTKTNGPVLQVFILSDLLALFSSALLGLAVCQLQGAPVSMGEAALAFLAAIGCVMAFRSIGHYRARQALSDQIRPVVQTVGLAFLMVSTARLALGESGFEAGLVLQWMLSPVLILVLRLGAREALKAEDSWYEPVLLIAPVSDVEHDAWLLKANDGHGLQMEESLDIQTLADLDDAALGATLRRLSHRPIFLAPDADSQAIAARVASRLSAQGAEFYYKPAIGRVPTEKLDLLDAPPAEGLLLRIGDSLNRPLARQIKRGFDLVVASLALIVLSPFFLIVAALIRRDGGKAFFVQERAGEMGRSFGCLKFRTMVEDAEARLDAVLEADPAKRAEWDAYQKLEDDPRITRVGQILRATSLDELPQLINVVKGEMSLIGPRPMMMDQREMYGASLDAYERMRPGITGLWQVNGRNATTFEERARLDNWYARNWSLWRDVVILVRTVREVFGQNGR